LRIDDLVVADDDANGLPSVPSKLNDVLPFWLVSTVMIVRSIPAPWMMIAFTLGG
jgi:hypothetical protein